MWIVKKKNLLTIELILKENFFALKKVRAKQKNNSLEIQFFLACLLMLLDFASQLRFCFMANNLVGLAIGQTVSISDHITIGRSGLSL